MAAPGPRLRFRSLGSGSGGNATLIEGLNGHEHARVLVDCGFTQREAVDRLRDAGCTPAELDLVFVTHEHGDHVGSALGLCKRHGVPLMMSRGTWRAIGSPTLEHGAIQWVRDGEHASVGPLLLRPFTVPHDAAEPLQLRVECGPWSLGLLTDAGSVTEHLLAHLRATHALIIEFNHDRDLLAASRYPPSLKARIAGPLGHLCNDTAARILAECMHGDLKHVVAAHLSEQNNSPDRVRAALEAACRTAAPARYIASQAKGIDWIELA